MTNRGIWIVDEMEIARMIKLPAGHRVVGVSADYVRMSVLICIEGDGLPEVGPGEQAPIVGYGIPGEAAAMPRAIERTYTEHEVLLLVGRIMRKAGIDRIEVTEVDGIGDRFSVTAHKVVDPSGWVFELSKFPLASDEASRG